MKKGDEEIDNESSEKTGLTEITDLNSVDDDSSEESSEDKSLINKLKAKIASLKKKKSSDEDEESDDEDEDEEEEKKKKRSKIIRVAIVGALLVFLASDYIFPPDENTPAPETPAVTETPPVDKKVEDVPPVEGPVEDLPEAVVDTPETSTDETPEVVDTPPIEDTTPSDVPAVVDTPTVDDSNTTSITPDDSPVDITSTDEDPAPSQNSSTDSVFGEDTSVGDLGAQDVTGGDDFTDQILQDLEKQANPIEEKPVVTKYVSPPDYDFRGRGLVYNCQGKHWACVDAPSYKICEDNASSSKHLNRTTECYPFNVYETVRGCEITQDRMVSSSAKTKFCNE